MLTMSACMQSAMIIRLQHKRNSFKIELKQRPSNTRRAYAERSYHTRETYGGAQAVRPPFMSILCAHMWSYF